jgi:hypothetical protein
MEPVENKTQYRLSLPAAMAARFEKLEGRGEGPVPAAMVLSHAEQNGILR